MDHLRIETPEYVEFSYDLAGLGSRFVAYSIDLLLEVTLWLLLLIGIGGFFGIVQSSSTHPADFVKTAGYATLALLSLITFLIFEGYFIFFELLWNGQTPGKRILGLRVMREGGFPITLAASVIRNLLRTVDFLPIFYGVGMAMIFATSTHRRIGDLAAATIVTREKAKNLSLHPLNMQNAPQANVRIDDKLYDLISRFLARRGDITLGNRYRLARELAIPLLDSAQGKPLSSGGSYEEFLEQVMLEHRKFDWDD